MQVRFRLRQGLDEIAHQDLCVEAGSDETRNRPTLLPGFLSAASSIPAFAEEVFGVEPVQGLRDEEAVLADQLVVEPDFAAAVIGTLDADHVPMDLRFVAVADPLVGLARREVEGARDLLIEKNIAHRLEDVRVEA